MRKLYPLILMLCCLFTGNRVAAQCAISISTSTNTTQLNCKDTIITLTATLTETGATVPLTTYQWSTGEFLPSINVSNAGTYFVLASSRNCQVSSSIIITKDIIVPTVSALAVPDTICAGSTVTLIGIGAASYTWQPGSLTGSVVSVRPASTTIYTVTGTDANGCSATDTTQIIVNPSPAASISGTATVCQNATPPSVMFTGVSGTPPYIFGYTINEGSLQSISSFGSNLSASIAAPTGILGTFRYDLQSVTDGNGCTQVQNGTAEITVTPAPVLTSIKTASVCNSALFNYTATSSSTGTNFTWRRSAISGITNPAASGASAFINETLNNTTTQPVVVTYLFTLSTGSGCITTDSLKVTVNPTPIISPIRDTTFCNRTFVSGGIPFTSNSSGASFSWTNSNPNIGLPASGTGGVPSFIANNNTANIPVIAVITVYTFIKAGTDSCPGSSTSFRITVLPSPVLTSAKTASVCTNAPFNYAATSSFPATSFSWTRDPVAGVTNHAASGASASINETLYDTTSQPVVVTYLFTLSAGSSCITTDSLKVTVNPTPNINPVSNYTFCNKTFVSEGIPFTSSSPGASFSWTNSNPNIGLPASGTGSIPSFVANNNTTNLPVIAAITVYTFIKAGTDNCPGSSTTFRITVLPGPVLTSAKTASVCTNAPFNYAATSSFPATSFSWTRDPVAGVTNHAASGASASINETLYDTTSQPVIVTYLFTLNAGTSCVVTDSLKVTVNPTPIINPVSDYTFCNRTFVNGGILFTSSSPGVSFSWTNNNPNIGLPASGTGSIPSFVANNNTTNISVTATITVHAFIKSGTDSCPGSSTTFSITVLPGPVLTSAKTVSVCNNASFNYAATSSFTGTSFTWRRDAVPGITNPAASRTTDSFDETLNNITSQPVVVTYLFTLSAGSSCITTDSLKVTVNPTPIISPVSDYTFCNRTFVSGGIRFTSSSPGASFSWTNSNTTIGLPARGTGNSLFFVANNNATNTSVTATITVYAFIKAGTDSCPGSGTTFRITVLPGPVLTSAKTTSVCNNAPFNYKATSSFTGTSFIWRRDSVAGITNPAAGRTTDSIYETLTNISSQPVVVTYLFTLDAGTGCIVMDSLKVTVNPTPVISPIRDTTFCNGTSVSGAISFTSSYPGTSFSWINREPGIGLPASGVGNNLSFVAINTTDKPVTTTITVYAFIKAGTDSCPGSSTTFRITVLPTPTFISAPAASACNNLPFLYTAKSYAVQTNFTWTRDAVAGITNPKDSGTTATVNETLHNVTSQPVDVIYYFTLSTGAGCVITNSVKVTVNTTPAINLLDKTASVCNNVPFSYFAKTISTNSQPAASVTWRRDAVAGISNPAGGEASQMINETLNNTTIQPVVVTYLFTLSSLTGCTTFDSLKVTVNPTPVIDPIGDITVCNGIFFQGIQLKGAPPDASFTWTNSNPNIGLPASGDGNIPSFVIKDTTTTGKPDTAIVTVSVTTSARCTGQSTTFKIIVKPSPSRPGFTSLFRYPDSDPLNVCQGSENINFNVNIPDKALTYNWSTSASSSAEVNIKNTHDTNTVVTFSSIGRYTVSLTASSFATGCSSVASQIVQVAAGSPGITKNQIFPLNNNLLSYGDNSLGSYQWGYDTVFNPLPNYSYGRPIPVQGQVFQYFIPARRFIDSVNHVLDLSHYTYWVLLQDHGCSTRFYYNGFYTTRVISNTPVSDTVKLQIIPNPNKGVFDISLEGNIYGNITAQIEDAMGRVVFTKNFAKMIPAVREKINTSNLPGGVYFLVLHSSDLKTVTSRFVIQR